MTSDPLPRPVPFWSGVLHTPLRDLLRCRLTGSLNVRSAIAAADLPKPIADLITKIVKRTRLWRVERVDVARELVTHFRDGLSAGHAPEELVQSFGDPRQAARLIRRAKLRGRPLVWRVWRRIKQAVGIALALLVASYLWVLVRYYTARPTIAHNYSLEITAPSRAVPEADRAWPLYRQALLELTPLTQVDPPPQESETVIPEEPWPLEPLDLDAEKPGSAHWAEALTWLETNRVAIELIRKGATRPDLGFIYGDPADDAWLKSSQTDPKHLDLNKNEPLYGLWLSQVQDLRSLMRVLQADARRADE